MKRKALDRLTRIAALRREIELAQMARMSQARDAVSQARADLATEVRQAEIMRQNAPAEAPAAGRFCAWAERRDAALSDDLATANEALTMQLARTARAVGQFDVLEKLSKTGKTP